MKKFRFVLVVAVLVAVFVIPSFATLYEFSGDGFSIYVDTFVRRPTVDDFEVGLYEYNYLLTFSDETLHWVTVDKPLYDDNGWLVTDGSAHYYQYQYLPGTFSYQYKGSGIYANDGFRTEYLYWASSNVLVLGSNQVAFEAIAPISLDGYNVMIWDGDTTDMEVFNDIMYKVSDFFSVGDAVLYVEGYGFGSSIPVTGDDIELLGWSYGVSFNDGEGGIPFVFGVGTSPDEDFLPNGVYFSKIGSNYPSLFAYTVPKEPTLFDHITSIFNSAMTMVGSVADTVVSSPLILLIVLIPLIFVTVVLFRRFLSL